MNSTDELDNGRVKRALFGFPLSLSNNTTNSTQIPLTNSSGEGPLGNVNPIPFSFKLFSLTEQMGLFMTSENYPTRRLEKTIL